ncbi:hypothetical protein ACOMHN_052456 [Nucella lapillus]
MTRLAPRSLRQSTKGSSSQQLRSDDLQRGVAAGAPPSREDEVSSTEDCPPSPVPGADPRYDSTVRAMQAWLEHMKSIYGSSYLRGGKTTALPPVPGVHPRYDSGHSNSGRIFQLYNAKKLGCT